MGEVIGPVSAVNGFRGAGAIRRAKIGSPASKTFGQLRVGIVSTVMTTPRSKHFSWAFAVANRDAIVAPVSRRQVSGRILIIRLTGRGTASRLYGWG
jgi:hypothetical protein